MDICVSCEQCNDGMEIIKEYSGRDGIQITVNLCEYCSKEIAKRMLDKYQEDYPLPYDEMVHLPFIYNWLDREE